MGDRVTSGSAARKLICCASSNAGKLREYRDLAAGSALEIVPLPNFGGIPAFEEKLPTFAENAAGKALHYSRQAGDIVLADDSGLVVPTLGGAPGVHSARYAGPGASDADCVRKLLRQMEGRIGDERRARFVCVCVIASRGRVLAIVSDSTEGILATEPHGVNGFGYDPVFCPAGSGRSFAELSGAAKNRNSHRGKAFRRLCEVFPGIS